MKNLFFLFLTAMLAAESSAQKVFFVYFQSEDFTPFYIRLSDKVHSSSARGYLILPNLTDSIYNVAVGFAKSTQPEARFAVSINQGDKGYLLKNLQDGLSLFDLQALSLIRSGNGASKEATAYETKTDRFSTILSKAADDPSVLKTPVAPKKEAPAATEPKETVVQQPAAPRTDEKVTLPPTEVLPMADTVRVSVIDSVHQAVVQPPAETVKPEPEKKEAAPPAAEAAAYKPSVIIRRSESSTTEGFGVVYVDQAETGYDTIRILIPAAKYALVPTETESSIAKDTGNSIVASTARTQDIVTDTVQVQTVSSQADQKLTCKNTATDKDFLKLRKNMAAKAADEDMVDEAKKAFKKQCYSVEQVRNLSALFLTPAAKYNFFDVAFGHVSDKEAFAGLAQEIKDEYFLKRFKALAGE